MQVRGIQGVGMQVSLCGGLVVGTLYLLNPKPQTLNPLKFSKP